MSTKLETQALELSFTILEDVIMAKPLTSKEEVLDLANRAASSVEGNSKYPEVVKMAYKEALVKLNSLTFEEMKEIREIIED